MALAWHSSGTVSNNTGTATTTSLGTTVAGQLIVVSYADDSATTTTFTSITDNASNTWTPVTTFQLNAVTYRMFYSVLTTGNAAHTVTANWSTAAAARCTVVAQYFDGFVNTPTFDQFNAGTGTGTSANTGILTPTTTAANELVVVGAAHASTLSTFTAGGGMSNIATVAVANAQNAQVSKVVAATGTQSGAILIAASRAWASTIATFKDVASGSVLTKTQSAVARVANDRTKTQPSVARIANDRTKTQTGIARISNNFTKTQSAIARISQTSTKTQPAIARVSNTRTKTQSAVARIWYSLSALSDNFDDNVIDTVKWTASDLTQIKEQNQELEMFSTLGGGYYQLQSNAAYDFTASSFHSQVVDAGNQSLGSLEVYPIQLQSGSTTAGWVISNGTANVYYNAGGGNVLPSSLAHVNGRYYRVRESAGSIFYDYSPDGLSWTNQYNTTNPLASNAVVAVIQIGTYSAEASTTTVKFDNANTTVSILTKTQSAVARIAQTSTKTQGAISRIAVNRTKTQTAIARIANNYTKTQTSIARVANTRTKTQPATARVAVISTKTQPATSRISVISTKTQPATARIQVSATKTQTATAYIIQASAITKTQSAVARIANDRTKTQPATAHIANTGTKTQSATARIATTSTKTQTAIARIAVNRTKTQSAISRISVTAVKTQPAIARISATRTKTQTAKAWIGDPPTPPTYPKVIFILGEGVALNLGGTTYLRI